MARNVQVIEVKSELGAGTNGASLGPDAIKIAALDFGSQYFKKFESIEVSDKKRFLSEPVTDYYAKSIKIIYNVCKRVAETVQNCVKNKNTFPIILSGDHSSSIGAISGIRRAFPEKRLGIIWIDAHADMHSPYTTPSGNMHGMSLAAVIREDNLEQRINRPQSETIEYWNKIKELSNSSTPISYSDIILIGLRDFEAQEEHLIKKNAVKTYSVGDLRTKGVERIAIESINLLEKCDLIYISFDVDSLDASISKGTGTPVPNGISEKEAGNLIAYLMRSKKICCFEIAEVNPTLDRDNLMAENAFEILLKATNQLSNDF